MTLKGLSNVDIPAEEIKSARSLPDRVDDALAMHTAYDQSIFGID